MTSSSIDTREVEHAAGRAQIGFVRVKSVRPFGSSDVYNMEVAGTHCFAINGGMIVHNCIDSLRYAIEQLRLSGQPMTKDYVNALKMAIGRRR